MSNYNVRATSQMVNHEKLWGFIIELGEDAKGRRRQKKSFKKSYTTKRQAKEAGEKWLAEYLKLVNLDTEETFKESVDTFLRFYKTSGIKETTYQSRVGTFNTLIKYAGDYKTFKMTQEDWQRIADEMIKTYAVSSIKQYFTDAKMLYNYFSKKTGSAYQPIKQIIYEADKHAPKALDEQDLPVFLEIDEVNAFLAAAENTVECVYYALFYLLVHSGMRIGEALALQWQDIDFKMQTVSIYKTLPWTTSCAKPVFTTPKTKSSNRKIYLSLDVLNVLEKLRFLQNQDKQQPNFVDTGLVFTSVTPGYLGHALTSSTIRDKINKVNKRVSFNKHITPHVFRHTHVSLLAQSGASLEYIQKRLGHASSNITTQIYLHVTKGMEQEMMGNYEKMFRLRADYKANNVVSIEK